jgi:simple sugar transport system permease protein
MPHGIHVVLCMLLATMAGAAWAGISGALRAITGANEVITTIMLNWIAIWLGVYLFSLGGPLQNDTQPSVPISNDVVPGAKLHVFWGDPELQGLHIGIFVAIAAAVVYWVLLNRSTKGYEARAVGFNPEAARYSGIKVGKTYVLVMATCGAMAGLAGSLDVLGWQFHLATNDIQGTQLAFLGIAVALLGRNTAIGTCLAALLFGAMVNGTSVRNLDPAVFEPELAQNLTTVIQGMVILFVSADVLVLYLYNKLRRRRPVSAEPVEVTA